jgi:hypothetical protein
LVSNEIRWDLWQERERGYQGDVYGTNDISHSCGMKFFLAKSINQLHCLISSRSNPIVSMQWMSEAV